MKAFLSAVTAPRLLLILAGALALSQAVAENRFLAFVLGVTMLNVLWTAGMNLLYGYTGLMPLMFAGVAGISAYASVGLVMKFGWSFWLAMPVSSVGAAVVGVLLGLPSLRLQGFYFTLCSLVIQTVLTLMFVFFPQFTNGDTGINQIPPPLIPFSGGLPLRGLPFDFVVAIIAWIGVAGVWAITRSELGRRLVAVREDPVLAETLGIDVVRCKLLSFFIGSLYAAIGGAFYAPYVEFISPRSFDVLASLNIWLMVAFGGRGTIMGPIIGTLILAPVPFLLQQLYTLKDILYGVLIIVVIILLPGGVYGEFRRRTEARLRGVARAALWKKILG